MAEDLRVAGVGGLIADPDRGQPAGALYPVLVAELHLAVALAAELGRKVRRPELLALHLDL